MCVLTKCIAVAHNKTKEKELKWFCYTITQTKLTYIKFNVKFIFQKIMDIPAFTKPSRKQRTLKIKLTANIMPTTTQKSNPLTKKCVWVSVTQT